MPNVTRCPACAAPRPFTTAPWNSSGEPIRWSDGWTSRIRIERHQPHGHGGDGRRRIPGDGLEQDPPRLHADLPQLLIDDEPMLVVANHDGRIEPGVVDAPRDRVLDQRTVGSELQELLRIERPRQRPQPRAGAAGQNDRMNLS
jgi:hypothetical protein